MRRIASQTSNLESDILKRVRANGGISRFELSRELGLAPSTAGLYVEKLLADGFLLETARPTRDAGRPPRILVTNPDGGEFIGVDFEARNIMAVAVDFSDQPRRNARRRIDAGDTVKQVVAKIAEAVQEVRPKAGTQLLAIGVGVPGIVDSSRGVALHYKYIPHWQNVPLAAELSRRFGVPVFLENNARSMALAELWFGLGRGHDDFLCVGIRSGIGVGMILNGRLYCGAHHAAGELGWWQCPAVSPAAADWFAAEDGAGKDGTELQEIASARAVHRAVQRAHAPGRKTPPPGKGLAAFGDVVQAAQQGDALTLQVVAEAARALGWAVAQMVLMADPAKILLAGPMTALGESFLEPLRERVRRSLQLSGVPCPEIANSTMGEFSGALGAAALALHEWKPAGAKQPSARVQK